MATFDALFRGVGNDLVELFGSTCTYRQSAVGGGNYDPLSGAVSDATIEYQVKAGVEQITRVENGGTNEALEAVMWFSHVTLPIEPTTSDTVVYQGKTWQVIEVNPQFAGDQLIAFGLKVRAN